MTYRFCVALFCYAALAFPGQASALYTFQYEQDGYPSGSSQVFGRFSGVPDQAGFITLASLASFDFHGLPNSPEFFSYKIDGGNSSFNLVDLTIGAGTNICVGAPAAFGGISAGVNCGSGGSNGFQGSGYNGQSFVFGTFTTQELPVITLVSIVPIPAAVPEPGTAALLAIGFLLTALSRIRWRPRSASAAISRAGIRRLP